MKLARPKQSPNQKSFNMNIRSALAHGAEYLRGKSNAGASIDVLAFLCEILRVNTAYLCAHGERELTGAEGGRFDEMLELSGSGMPSAYVLGFKEFMSLRFKVNQHVLIPRPETELLTEMIIDRCASRSGFSRRMRKENSKILDIGTGSGCIAVCLAHHLPKCTVTAVDVSPDALRVAAENAKTNGMDGRIRFVVADMLKGLDELGESKFDVIVSNPPYVASDAVETLEKSVYEFEPRTALDGGAAGLAFYPALKAAAVKFLEPGGFLVMEIGYDQANQIRYIFSDLPGAFSLANDYSGIARFAFIDL